jgi:hypothetical protein
VKHVWKRALWAVVALLSLAGCSPATLISGTADKRINPGNSRRLAARIRAHGGVVEERYYDDVGAPKSSSQWLRRCISWRRCARTWRVFCTLAESTLVIVRASRNLFVPASLASLLQ